MFFFKSTFQHHFLKILTAQNKFCLKLFHAFFSWTHIEFDMQRSVNFPVCVQ